MLQRAQLVSELEAFHDAGASSFVGYPSDRESARDRWAEAFTTYVSELECLDPLLSPTDGATFALVEAAFRGPLTLLNKMSAAATAAEFSAAWLAGVSAILLLGAPATYSALPVSAIIWNPPTQLSDRKNQLESALTALFQAPAINPSVRLQAIAAAFHLATTALTAQAALPAGATQVLTYG